MGAQLPKMTCFIIYLSKQVKSLVIFFGLFLLILSSFFIFIKKKYPIIQRKLDRWYLKIPILNKYLLLNILARLSRGLSIALTAGMPLLEALYLVSEMIGNYTYKEIILSSCGYIRNGAGLFQALSYQKLPLDFLQLIQVGETANCLNEVFSNIAELYDEKIDYFFNSVTALIEPISVIALGLIIGCIVIAMYLPMFRLGSVV